MSGATGIEWCDATFNPWWGCERVSPGCAHCYADTLARRYGFGDTWGEGHGFRFFGDKHWAEPLKWARTLPAKLGRRPRVFCASMADVFEERDELVVPRERLFQLVFETPELDWLILTKRPDVARDLLGWSFPMHNVWIGTSIENSRFTWRADVLREIPAAVRFLSCEPLLGSLFEPTVASRGDIEGATGIITARAPLNLERIDWVIVGGESGPKARPMNPEWAREIRDACLAEDKPETFFTRPAIFFKQWGGVRPKTGGRSLDGYTWDEFPVPQVSLAAGVSETTP